jgi:hypothetical protein
MLHLKMSKRLPVFLFVMIGTVFITSVSADWHRVGFAGKEIRALAAGRDASNRQVVFIPVDDSGVFMMYTSADSIYQSPFRCTPNDRPTGKIHSLLLAQNGVTMLVGTDSGLYGASLLMSSVPTWRKISLANTETVTGIAKSDSAFCAITASGVYRSKNTFDTWLPCSLSGVPVRPASGSVFTAVASWPRGRGFAVGSAASGGGALGGSVIFGTYDARTWTNSTCVTECTCIDSAVYSLVADSQITIYAGTSKGFVFGVDFDTGCWHSRPPQLVLPVRDMCLTRMTSTWMPPDVYVANDSGVYLQSMQTTASGMWNRLFTRKTFAVEVMEVNGEPVIYAGTADGLWKYDRSTTAGARRSMVPLQPAAEQAALYSLDGRLLRQSGGKTRRGVAIVVEHTGRCGVSMRHLLLQ